MSRTRKAPTEAEMQASRDRAEQMIEYVFARMEEEVNRHIGKHGEMVEGFRVCSSRVTLEELRLVVWTRKTAVGWTPPVRAIEDFTDVFPVRATS